MLETAQMFNVAKRSILTLNSVKIDLNNTSANLMTASLVNVVNNECDSL